MRDEDIEFLQDDRRFLDMTMGEPYEGKYRFADIQQGEKVMQKLVEQHRRVSRKEREYEEELKDVEEIEKITQREYGKLMVQLKVKEDILADARRHADRIKRDYAGCRRQTRKYSDAIQQARQSLDAMQEGARGYKRSSDEIEVDDPKQGSDREIEPCDPPGIVLRRAPTRIGSEEVQKALRRQAAGDQEREYRRYAREEPCQHQRYPTGCTLVVDGVPYRMTEGAFLPLLLSAFGKWGVPHEKIIGCNVLRDVSQVEGTATYINRGQVIIRFASREYMNEYRGHIRGRNLRCDLTGRRRDLRTCEPPQDLEIRPRRHRRDVLVSARFFEEVWDAHAVE